MDRLFQLLGSKHSRTQPCAWIVPETSADTLPRLPFRIGAAVAGVAALSVVLLDQLTKKWAVDALSDGDITVISGLLEFQLTGNSGASFGLFRNGGTIIGIGAILAVVLVGFMLRSVSRRSESVALGLIVGGAVGNLADRVFRGSGFLDGLVVDWIRLPSFPNFNIADSAITIGAALLIWLAIFRR